MGAADVCKVLPSDFRHATLMKCNISCQDLIVVVGGTIHFGIFHVFLNITAG
jgi:hypothetical protein